MTFSGWIWLWILKKEYKVKDSTWGKFCSTCFQALLACALGLPVSISYYISSTGWLFHPLFFHCVVSGIAYLTLRQQDPVFETLFNHLMLWHHASFWRVKESELVHCIAGGLEQQLNWHLVKLLTNSNGRKKSKFPELSHSYWSVYVS